MNVRFGRVPGVDCSAPASRVVEGYAPADGRAHGSLDVLLYACEAHHEDARKVWAPSFGAPTPYSLGEPSRPHLCGEMTDFRDPKPQDVEPETQDVGELGLLDPMPYTLTVNGSMAMRGTLQEVRNGVAHLVTEWLADDPEGLALDAQTVNMAFNSGAVQQELDERGEWYTVMRAHSPNPMRIKVTKGD